QPDRSPRTHAVRTAGRRTGGHGHNQPGHRSGALHQPEDGRAQPRPGLSQTRHPQPCRAGPPNRTLMSYRTSSDSPAVESCLLAEWYREELSDNAIDEFFALLGAATE